MEIIQHIPNFISGVRPKKFIVDNINDVLDLDWVKAWKDDVNEVPFYRYSKSEYCGEYQLIAEYRNSKHHKWYVVGFMTESAELPNFKPSYPKEKE